MAKSVGSDAGFPDLRVQEYPGTISLHSVEQIHKNLEEVTLPGIIALLTQPVDKSGAQRAQALGNTDVAFSGNFGEVNKYFQEHQWSDGLPVVPPTLAKVQEFMKFTDRDPDEVITVMPPRHGAATVWKVAVNGVMAGCRPEYMPILLAIVDIMADPQFNIQDSGSTPGWEAIMILNGPIRDQLGFNYKEGVMRPGSQPNTSIGRFYRLFLRNVAGFLPGANDQATFGHNFRVVVPENDDIAHAIGWKTLAERRGFGPDENVLTITSARAMSDPLQPTGTTAEQALSFMTDWANRMTDAYNTAKGYAETNVLLLSPAIAEFLAGKGYSDADVIDYVKRNSLITARAFEENVTRYNNWVPYNLCEEVTKGTIGKEWCESDDPDRLVPHFHPNTDILVTITGDEKRNRGAFIRNNFRQGFATSRTISLPSNWEDLLSESQENY